ncbi:ABC-2 transporter permease [Christensenellaceae bacterium OttesenSCG-928-M15]|nr:ABC-2 transporter permease [Christensenellaceae bacterium OttesenSCG-928-M15]
MKSLILKDFYAVRSMLSLMLAFIVLLSVISFMSAESASFSYFYMLFLSLMPFTCLSLDERSKLMRFALTTRVTRKDLILSKYVFGLVLCLAAFGFGVIEVFVLNGAEPVHVLLLFAFLAIALLLQAIIMPLMFRFGSEKARIFMILFVAAVSAATTMFLSNADITDITTMNIPLGTTMGLLTALAVVAYAVSILISLRIYRNKDFS